VYQDVASKSVSKKVAWYNYSFITTIGLDNTIAETSYSKIYTKEADNNEKCHG